jgi:hypothetical protein
LVEILIFSLTVSQALSIFIRGPEFEHKNVKISFTSWSFAVRQSIIWEMVTNVSMKHNAFNFRAEMK